MNEIKNKNYLVKISLILSYCISHFQHHFSWLKQKIYFKDGLINVKGKVQCKYYNPLLGFFKTRKVGGVLNETAATRSTQKEEAMHNSPTAFWTSSLYLIF